MSDQANSPSSARTDTTATRSDHGRGEAGRADQDGQAQNRARPQQGQGQGQQHRGGQSGQDQEGGGKEMDRAGQHDQQHDGEMEGSLDEQTGKLSTDNYIIAAGGSMLASMALQLIGQSKLANFVGHWVPTILVLGLYSKLNKEGGQGESGGDQESGDRPRYSPPARKRRKQRRQGRTA